MQQATSSVNYYKGETPVHAPAYFIEVNYWPEINKPGFSLKCFINRIKVALIIHGVVKGMDYSYDFYCLNFNHCFSVI